MVYQLSCTPGLVSECVTGTRATESEMFRTEFAQGQGEFSLSPFNMNCCYPVFGFEMSLENPILCQ